MAEASETIELRGGFHATDPRLDRLPRWDVRNEDYLVRPLLRAMEVKIPRSYTWSVPITLDQGSEGACVGFGWTHELAARPVQVAGLTAAFAREKVYWEAQRIDPWDGGSYPGASPRYEGTDVLSGAKVLQAAGYFKEYRWATTLNDLILAVGYKGPVVLGVNWYEGMFDADSDGFIHASGNLAGGHCILAYGVSVKGKYVKLWNSWGPSWGVGGACKVSFEDTERLLGEFGEACIPSSRSFTGTA